MTDSDAGVATGLEADELADVVELLVATAVADVEADVALERLVVGWTAPPPHPVRRVALTATPANIPWTKSLRVNSMCAAVILVLRKNSMRVSWTVILHQKNRMFAPFDLRLNFC